MLEYTVCDHEHNDYGKCGECGCDVEAEVGRFCDGCGCAPHTGKECNSCGCFTS